MEESLGENLRQYLKRFLRPTYLLSVLAEFTVEELFWNASVEKAGSDLACAMHMTVMALGSLSTSEPLRRGFCPANECEGSSESVRGRSGSSSDRASGRLSMSRSRRVRR